MDPKAVRKLERDLEKAILTAGQRVRQGPLHSND